MTLAVGDPSGEGGGRVTTEDDDAYGERPYEDGDCGGNPYAVGDWLFG